jgi:hypothetical protein
MQMPLGVISPVDLMLIVLSLELSTVSARKQAETADCQYRLLTTDSHRATGHRDLQGQKDHHS